LSDDPSTGIGRVRSDAVQNDRRSRLLKIAGTPFPKDEAAMPTKITVEKVKEVIRLAEQAQNVPGGRADDPQRGGPGGTDGLSRPGTPPEPQPASNWQHAFERYLMDLPNPALAELIGLYHNDADAPDDGRSQPERVAFLTSRTDLVDRLNAALDRI
jgi:hypothetical protein